MVFACESCDLVFAVLKAWIVAMTSPNRREEPVSDENGIIDVQLW